jgi:hypothetical protein
MMIFFGNETFAFSLSYVLQRFSLAPSSHPSSQQEGTSQAVVGRADGSPIAQERPSRLQKSDRFGGYGIERPGQWSKQAAPLLTAEEVQLCTTTAQRISGMTLSRVPEIFTLDNQEDYAMSLAKERSCLNAIEQFEPHADSYNVLAERKKEKHRSAAAYLWVGNEIIFNVFDQEDPFGVGSAWLAKKNSCSRNDPCDSGGSFSRAVQAGFSFTDKKY